MTLYHYTSVSALANILATCGDGSSSSLKEWWLFDYRQANDPTEVRYGREQVAMMIENGLFQRMDTNKNLLWYHQLQWKQALVECIKEIAPASVFIASFSELQDDLGQWRAYGDDGRGVAIGLELDGRPNTAFHVQYPRKSATWDQFCDNLIEKIEHELSSLDSVNIQDSEGRAKSYASLVEKWSNWLPQFSNAIKHPHYFAEKEHRLIHMPGLLPAVMGPFTRMSGNHLMRYVVRPFTTPQRLIEVIAGPKLAQRPVNLDSLKTLLHQYNFSETAVIPSEIPYA